MQGGSDRYVTARIGKARAAFVKLNNMWASKKISIVTKLHIVNSNVAEAARLYSSETWRTTTMMQKITMFIKRGVSSRSSGRTKISSEEPWRKAGQELPDRSCLEVNWTHH